MKSKDFGMKVTVWNHESRPMGLKLVMVKMVGCWRFLEKVERVWWR